MSAEVFTAWFVEHSADPLTRRFMFTNRKHRIGTTYPTKELAAMACRNYLKQKYGDAPLSWDDGRQFSHPNSGAPVLRNDAFVYEGDPHPGVWVV